MNRDNFRKLALHIYNNPEKFDMSEWLANRDMDNVSDPVFSGSDNLCGTVGCIAGSAFWLENDGQSLRLQKSRIIDFYETENSLQYRSDGELGIGFFDGDYQLTDASDIYLHSSYVQEIARKYLGITPREGNKLFYTTADSVWSMIGFCEPYRYIALADIKYYRSKSIYREGPLRSEWQKYVYQGPALNKITAAVAADVLLRIADGEILLAPEPSYTDRDFYNSRTSFSEHLVRMYGYKNIDDSALPVPNM